MTQYYNVTTIHPIGLAAVLTLSVATLLISKRYAIIPMLMVACLIPSAQRIIVAGADMTFVRIIALAGIARVFMRREYTGFKWMSLDSVVVAWGIVGIIMQTLLWGDTNAFVARTGYTVETLSIYFFGRVMLRDWPSLKTLTGALAVLALVVGPFIVVEYMTRRNVFSVFGGVSEITMVRDGRLRCQGAFSHPILAGVFWACALPLIAARLWDPGAKRWLAALSTASCLWIAVASASATPLGALAGVALGALMFFLRRHMQLILLGCVVMLCLLHMVMKGPVWSLIARTNIVGGASGYHRFLLVDGAIKNFSDWAAIGTRDTSHWGHQTFDIANQFVLEGVRGGVLLLGLFSASIWIAFVYTGRAWRKFLANRTQVAYCWALGVSLFAHCASFIGVSYWGQTVMLWYLTLAAAGALGEMTLKHRVQRVRRRAARSTPATASRAARPGYRERLSTRIAKGDSERPDIPGTSGPSPAVSPKP